MEGRSAASFLVYPFRSTGGKFGNFESVVEFYYSNNTDLPTEFRWIPIRTRYDKTEFVKLSVDAQNLPFEDKSLDGLILVDVLHHIPKPRVEKYYAQDCILYFHDTRLRYHL